MTNPEKAYYQKRTVDNSVLSKSEQAFYDWYLRHSREARVATKDLAYMDEFDDVYDAKKIAQDKKWVFDQRSKDSAADHTERAEIAEYIMETFANDSQWFGDESAITKTSEYDDRKHHTDFVVEWDSEDGTVDCALALDVTVASRSERIENKLKSITNELDSGSLTNIEYFNSYLTGEVGSLDMIPRALIVFDKDRLPELCESLIIHTSSEDELCDTEKDHYMKIFLLTIVEEQLQKQLEYLSEQNSTGSTRKRQQYAQEKIEKTLQRISQELEIQKNNLSEISLRKASEAVQKVHDILF